MKTTTDWIYYYYYYYYIASTMAWANLTVRVECSWIVTSVNVGKRSHRVFEWN